MAMKLGKNKKKTKQHAARAETRGKRAQSDSHMELIILLVTETFIIIFLGSKRARLPPEAIKVDLVSCFLLEKFAQLSIWEKRADTFQSFLSVFVIHGFKKRNKDLFCS